MSITHELREYTEKQIKWLDMTKVHYRNLFAIADRIDAEHEKAIASVMNDALYHANEKDMAELGWIRLPKDADGVPVCIGDRMEWVRYKDGDPTIVRTVSGIGNGVFFAWSDEQGRYAQYEAHAYRHHHAPTVEDVLTEFGIDWEHESDCEDRAALLREYAAKLRLAEGEDA